MSTVDTVESPATVSGKLADSIGDVILLGAETAARHSVGQALLKLADRFLWVVEKSAQWSLPVQDTSTAGENGETFGKMELVRPLPWIFFLPGLVMLRAVRVGLSIGAFILGFPKIQPSGMVKFIQKGRRRLRAIKFTGLKDMRQRKTSLIQDGKLSEAKKSLIRSMLATLSCLSDLSERAHSPSPVRIHVRNDPEAKSTVDDNSKTGGHTNSGQTDSKRKYSQVSAATNSSDDSEDEELRQKIDRLAAEDSADDQDFDPEEVSASEEASTGDESDVPYMESSMLILDAQSPVCKPGVAPAIIDEEPELAEDEKQSEEKNEESKPEEKKAEESHKVSETSSKFGADSDTVYYSPISSKSSTPEYTAPPARIEQQQNMETQQNDVNTADGNSSLNSTSDNGDMNSSTASTISGNSVEGATNGPSEGKRQRGCAKASSKGKRSGLATRKKK